MDPPLSSDPGRLSRPQEGNESALLPRTGARGSPGRRLLSVGLTPFARIPILCRLFSPAPSTSASSLRFLSFPQIRLSDQSIASPFFSRRSQAPRAKERLRPAARRSPASLSRLTRSWFLPLTGPSKKADLGTWEPPPARALRVVCLERLRASKGENRCLTIQ